MSRKRGSPRPQSSPREGELIGRRRNVDALRIYWGRWTEVVEMYALRHQGRRRVDPRAYQDLYRMLIEACEDLEKKTEGTPHDYKKMQELVRPWLTTRVLAQTNRDILCDLLKYCREIEKELGGRRRVPLIPLLKTLSVTTVLVGGSLLLWFARGTLFFAADFLQGWLATGWLAFQTSGEREAMFAGGIILTLVSIYVISRRPRD